VEYTLGGLVVAAALAFVALPLLRPRRTASVGEGEAAPSLAEQRAAVYRELLELELDHRVGKLDAADYQSLADGLRARAALLLSAEDATLRQADEQVEREIAEQRAALRAAGRADERSRS
jgi:hypothetical protein